MRTQRTKTLLGCLAIVFAFLWHYVHAAAPLTASAPVQPGRSGAGSSFDPIFSAGGHHLVFISHANNLVTNDDLGLSLDVFVRDLVVSNTVLVSVSTNGFGGANMDANYPSVSSNGQFIAFASRASNLVSGDTNGASDVFVRDTLNGVTRLVSVDVNGRSPVDPAPSLNVPLSGYPQISGDGRWVFFESRATSLIAAGAPLGSVNIYARDTWSNITVLVTADTNGAPVADKQELSSISADGRFVAFVTTNNSFVSHVTNSGGDVYVRDVQLAVTIWASTNVPATLGPRYGCAYPVLNEDGRYVALLAATNAHYFLFRYNMTNPFSQFIAQFTPLMGAPATALSRGKVLQLSADASRIAYESAQGTYVWHENPWPGGVEWVVSCPQCNCADGGAAPPITWRPSLSRDGRFLSCIQSCRSTVALHFDLETGTHRSVIVAVTNGTPTPITFLYPTISPDGSLVAFDSTGSDLAVGDLNGASDIFLRDMNTGRTELISKAHQQKPAATAQSLARLGPNSISADARFVVFTRYDDPSAFRDTNEFSDVFLSNLQSGSVTALSIDTNLYVTGGGGSLVTNTAPNTNSFFAPVISADGTTVAALQRRIPILNPNYDIVLARSSNGVFGSGMRRAVVPYSGAENGVSDSPSLSSDGQVLVFQSTADNLTGIGQDSFQSSDIFLRLLAPSPGASNPIWNGTYMISRSTNGFNSGDGPSIDPVFSLDGRWVAFRTKAGNLLTNGGGPYATFQLLLADLGTNRLGSNYLAGIPKRLVSDPAGQPFAVDVTNAVFSADGRAIAFSTTSSATYLHDVMAGDTTLVCTNCANATVSANGRSVAFTRARAPGITDVSAMDFPFAIGALVSANQLSVPGNGSSGFSQISGDGRYVVFQSKASDLVPNDANGVGDIFVRDRLLGVTMLVSANAQGWAGNGPSSRPVMGSDGRTVVFQSFASDLVGNDYNDKRDVFMLKLGSADTEPDGMDDDWEVDYFENRLRDGTGDFDGDGQTDRQEFLAGTDPTNGGSVFRVLTVTPVGGGSTRVMWSAAPNRSYRIEYKDDLNATGWSLLDATISWNGATASATDNSPASTRYYRVVRLP